MYESSKPRFPGLIEAVGAKSLVVDRTLRIHYNRLSPSIVSSIAAEPG
jgi:hypothetical protein